MLVLLCRISVTGHPSESMNSLRVWYYLVAQAKVEVWLRGPYNQPLTKWPNPQNNRII